MPRSIPSRSCAPILAVVAVLATVACSDAADDPMAALMTQETLAALDPGLTLPNLMEVWIEAGGILDDPPVTRWEDSWELPTPEGRAVRALVYDDAAPSLFERLGEGGLDRLLIDMDSTLARVDRLSGVGVPERVGRRLEEARRMWEAAGVLAEGGEGASSLSAVLQAADYLREVTPFHVAARLLASAESGVGRTSAADPYSEETLGRVERLIDVAREAIHEGDYARAIRGSYYACLLLGVELPD